MPKSRDILNAKQTRFVDEYIRLGHAGNAAKAAGLAYTAGSRLLHHPTVAAQILERQAKLRSDTDYTVKVAMREAEQAMDDARAWKNANALVKAVELRSRLMGLLVEKLDVRQLTNFRINILGMPGSPAVAALPPINVDAIAHVPMKLNPHKEVEPLPQPPEEDIFGI